MAEQAKKKPNMLIIWGDDIGQSNVSAYSKGVVGYHTPNIDRSTDTPTCIETMKRPGRRYDRGPVAYQP